MNAERIAAEIYDHTIVDWPAEMRFYEQLALEAQSVLEVACGTGRVGLRLATTDRTVHGLDLSPYMIHIARAKSRRIPHTQWQVADMRSFELGRTYDLVIIPGHSFQFMLGIPDQLSCLHAIRKHLAPAGRLVVHVDHQDLAWLGALPTDAEGQLDEPQTVGLPDGRVFRIAKRWSYDRVTQTASVVTSYEALDVNGTVKERATRGPVRLHCFFRYEMELLWQRARFEVEALCGDFTQAELGEKSTEMVWLLRTAPK